MFKNVTIYRIAPGTSLDATTIEAGLGAARFAPCGFTQDKSVGWVAPRGSDHDALAESVAGQIVLRLMIETKSVPTAAVRKKADEEAVKIEAMTGRKPGKKEMKALREDALLSLLPQAFARQSAVLVWIDRVNGWVVTDASSQGKRDEVVTALVRSIDGLELQLLQTTVTPQSGMTQWLSAQEASDWPGEFSIERECELKSNDEEKSVVKFGRHNLATDEVRQHIAEGKLPTCLAMSHGGRVSFVLTEGMNLKKIAFLDAKVDGTEASGADGFDTDVALATGELQILIPALIDALGGELSLQSQQSAAAGAASYSDGPDELLEKARSLVVGPEGRASISYIQRHLQIGYNRAASLMEDLERLGVVSAPLRDGSRTVLASGGIE